MISKTTGCTGVHDIFRHTHMLKIWVLGLNTGILEAFLLAYSNIPSAIVSQVPDEKELRDLQQEMWKCRRKAMDPRGLNFWIFCKRIKQQANAQHQLSPEEKVVHGPELVWFHSVARCCKSLIVRSRSNRLAYLYKVEMLNLVTPAAHLWGPKHWRSQPFAAVWSGLGDCHQREVGPSGSVCLVQFICNRQVIFHWGTLAC
jgi:hypothetical protein